MNAPPPSATRSLRCSLSTRSGPLLDRLDVPETLVLAVAAALGDDLLASDDESAAAHWRELPGGAPPGPAPPLPVGAQPLAQAVRAPRILALRLRQVGLVARADGRRYKLRWRKASAW